MAEHEAGHRCENGGPYPIRVALVCREQYPIECLATGLAAQGGFEFISWRFLSDLETKTVDWETADVALLDSRIGIEQLLACTREIQAFAGRVKVAIFGVEESGQRMADLITAGAKCYISSNATFKEVATVLRRVANGEAYCSPPVAFDIFERLSRHSRRNELSTRVRSAQLTARELEILRMLGEHLENEQIAKRLYLSVTTVKNHVHRILSKLGVRNRYQAAACWADMYRGDRSFMNLDVHFQ